MVRHPNVISDRLRPFRVGPHSSDPRLVRWLVWLTAAAALTACALSFSLTAYAQQASNPTAAPMAQPGQTYTVRSGDTLDRIISESLGQTPFNQTFLREAFAQLNPRALPQGPRGPLVAGASLRIPDAAALRRLAFPGEAPDTRASAQSAAPVGDSGGYVPDVRQSWIRYP